MGLLDLFGAKQEKAGGDAPPAVPVAKAKTFHEDRARMFDLQQTSALSELFAVPPAERKAAWQGAFFHAAWTASLELGEPAVLEGPDGFRYLRLQMPAAGQAFQSNSLGNVAREAMENLTGAAIFASAQAVQPEYVMSMGILDSLLTYDTWLGDPVDVDDVARSKRPEDRTGGIQTFTTEKETQILVGTPSAALLPAHTARGLHHHLKHGWKIEEPRVSLMVNPATAPSRSLVINKKLSEFPSAEIAGKQAGFLLWYLPPRRGMMLMPESWKQEDMKPLSGFFAQAQNEAKP